jgi:selenocysteine-specific elongation factor
MSTAVTRSLILGTAGHIDHGKTSLVRALTGIDCDRLPEEKARGITIDIGFARLELPGYQLGVVDVPGHERFIRNMLAGATGFDLAMLVVAADDSIMPQTREHLEILRLLGLRHGVIALTKCDLVDQTTREVVELEVRELVRGSFLENAPLVHTSASSGMGLGELRDALARACADCAGNPRSTDPGWFRMAIDRSFVVQGHGTVVTGTVMSGAVRVGDEVSWLPSGQSVRVRAIHRHDKPAESVSAGMRAALNLAGVRHEEVARGQEIASSGLLVPSRVVSLRVRALANAPRPLRHRQQLRMHLGTSECLATLSLLDCDRVAPGDEALAQLFVESPITATWGQAVVMRDASGRTTLGGGRVIQPTARKIRRRHVEDLEHLEKQAGHDADARCRMACWFAGFGGVSGGALIRDAGMPMEDAACWIATGLSSGQLIEIPAGGTRRVVLEADRVVELESRLLATADRLHGRYPLLGHHERQKVEAGLDYLGDTPLVAAILDRLVARKALVGPMGRVGLPDFKPRLTAAQRRLKEQIVQQFREKAFTPPDADDLKAIAGANASHLKEILDVCEAEGWIVPFAEGMWLHSSRDQEMRKLVVEKLKELASSNTGLLVADIRTLLGTSRKFAVPLCEYLDRAGVTRRDGDIRWLATPTRN